MATATDATATPYLNTAWMIAPQRAGGGGGRMPAAGATGRSGPPPRVVRGASAHHPCDDTRRDASYSRPSLRRAGAWRCLAGSRCASQRRRPRHACNGERYACTTVVMECRCATPALRRRGSASGSCRSVISSRAWDAEGLENQSLALNSTIPVEPAACEAFRRGAAHYERLPHALDAPRGASRTGRVARAEMRSAEERSRARLWSSKAPQARRPVAANHNTGVSTPIKASTREAGVVVAGL